MSWVSSNTKIQDTTPTEEYSRPSDWPVLPTVVDGNQVFYGLHAVFDDDSNFIALSAEGAYTVDWGDGSTPENVSSGVQANHIYDYSSVTSSVTARGYKTVVVTVTPQSGNLTGLNLSRKHTQAGLQNYATGWLELAIGGSFSASGLVIGAGSTISHRFLERVVCIFGTSSVTNMSNMFCNCSSLRSVPLFVTSAVTSMSYMFNGCYSLQSVPLFVTSAVTNMSGMFSGCYSLQSVPLFVTSAVTSMSYMFNNCYSLRSVPLFVTSAVTSMSYMFNGCYSLSTILMSTINVTLSLANCKLSRTALVTLFNNLATVAGQTLTITGNWGIANLTAEDRLIATSKGWTLVEA